MGYRQLADWFADDWITRVYQPGRSSKVTSVKLNHTMEMGSRYTVHLSSGRRVSNLVTEGQLTLARYY